MTRTALKSITHIDGTQGVQALDGRREREDVKMHVNAQFHRDQTENSNYLVTLYL